MYKILHNWAYIVPLIALVAFTFTAPASSAAMPPDEEPDSESIEGWPVIVRADERYFPARVPAPSQLALDQVGVQSVRFTVNYNPATCSGTLAPWPVNAAAAFDRATRIWGVLLTGSQTIEIDACWRTDLATGILGSSMPTLWYRDFSGRPVAGTWYPVALANQLSGTDRNGGNAEMITNYNANRTWYMGLDGDPPPGQSDFVTVAMHEIAHGLGFSGSMSWDDGILSGGEHECDGTSGHGCWDGGESDAYPAAYDRFVENNAGQSLVGSFDNNSTGLGNQLTSGALFFDGPHANAANRGNPPRLFAPIVWNPGSSFSHLNEATFNGTNHALMTPAIANGESAHHPGTIALGILRDTGWTAPHLSEVWVDLNATGDQDGTRDQPFDTVAEGVRAVYPGGTVWIHSGTYPEALTLYRAMELQSTGGIVTIGAGVWSSD